MHYYSPYGTRAVARSMRVLYVVLCVDGPNMRGYLGGHLLDVALYRYPLMVTYVLWFVAQIGASRPFGWHISIAIYPWLIVHVAIIAVFA